ncbi:hypothetical protein LOTGIDRAFT_168269 [Lottia gigantea]|uniref:Neurotransmitter-gated ion-channel ligand-binding domain-containing protein n=1 Tax=Lottia gigantea TaxID=225164 RepID=V3ZL48_LOTGI|nr:hypothetical protein LOTGIDRAFT_168269 [Lottia gigantea]ESO85007.1 hypothetical protein LOTGIDRAFT_168269 [Lottia gigantea]
MDLKQVTIFLLDLMAIASAINSDIQASRLRLFRDLFLSYEASLIPAEQINVTLGLELINIVELNEVKEYLDIHCFLYTQWTDKRLQWNSTEYGVPDLRVLIGTVWQPDISLYDGVEEPQMFNDGRGFVLSNGLVMWIPAVRIKAKCNVDVKNFPFDTQTCTMKFGSWIHSGNSLDVQTRESESQSAFQSNLPESRKGWQLVNSSVRRDVTYYKCCPEPYPSITFTLTLKRSPVYYVHVYILPAVLLSLLVPIQLFLPPKSKERITIGTGLIIANILMVLRLQDVLPDQHLEIPRLGMFYSLNLTWSVLSVLTTILVLNIHNRGSRQGRVPESLRSVFLRSLKSIVCLGDDSYYPFTSSESVSMKGLENPCVPDSPGGNNPSFKGSGAKTESSMVKEVEYIGKQVNLLTCRSNLQEGRDDIQNEWMQLALVLDRVFFFFFFLSYLIYTVVIMA